MQAFSRGSCFRPRDALRENLIWYSSRGFLIFQTANLFPQKTDLKLQFIKQIKEREERDRKNSTKLYFSWCSPFPYHMPCNTKLLGEPLTFTYWVPSWPPFVSSPCLSPIYYATLPSKTKKEQEENFGSAVICLILVHLPLVCRAILWFRHCFISFYRRGKWTEIK
jgi:hypothetical protein